MRAYFLNGPNANLYGLDSSGTYGKESYPRIAQRCGAHAKTLGIELDFRQTNHEGVLVDWIQEARLQAELPDLAFYVAPDIADPQAVRHALVWKPPSGFFAAFPNLALVVISAPGSTRWSGATIYPTCRSRGCRMTAWSR